MTDLDSRSKRVLKSIENKDKPIDRHEGREKDGKRDKRIRNEKENYEGARNYSKGEKECKKEKRDGNRHGDDTSIDREIKRGRNSEEGRGEKNVNDLRKVIENIEKKKIDIEYATEKNNISKDELEDRKLRYDYENVKRKEDKRETIHLDKIKIDRSKEYNDEKEKNGNSGGSKKESVDKVITEVSGFKNGSLLHTSRSESDGNMNDSSESLKKSPSPEPSKPKNVQERLRIMAGGDRERSIERGVWLRQQMEAMKSADHGKVDQEPTEEEILRQEKLPIIKHVNEYRDPIRVWKPIEESDSKIPPWNKDLLPTEHEEKPSDWVPPSPPIVDKSLLQFIGKFHDEIKNPPAIDKIVVDKDRMKVVEYLSDGEELLLMNNFCIIRTTPAAIKKSKRSREIEEEEDARNNSRFSRGGGGRGGRGRGGRGGGRGRRGWDGGKPNANTEPMGAIKRPMSRSYSLTRPKMIRMDKRYQERVDRDFRRDNSRYARGDDMSTYGRENDREEISRYREDSSRFERSLRDRSRSRSRRDDHKQFREISRERDNFKEHREPTEAYSGYSIGGKRHQSPGRNRYEDSGYRKSRNEKNESKTSSRYCERSNDYGSRVRRDDHGTRDRHDANKFKQERKESPSDSNSSWEMPREIKDSPSDSNSSFGERSSTPNRMSYRDYKFVKAAKEEKHKK